jgi:hypothetical protein
VPAPNASCCVSRGAKEEVSNDRGDGLDVLERAGVVTAGNGMELGAVRRGEQQQEREGGLFVTADMRMPGIMTIWSPAPSAM